MRKKGKKEGGVGVKASESCGWVCWKKRERCTLRSLIVIVLGYTVCPFFWVGRMSGRRGAVKIKKYCTNRMNKWYMYVWMLWMWGKSLLAPWVVKNV